MVKDNIEKEIKKKAINGKIPCPVARKLAKELSISYKEVGKAADQLNIKITDCDLGCF
jgi:DNA-binding transcriptional regulator YhcF (GntR family)